ncbi:MAG TPA: 16S rRNA (adenine(1518)-N(6)/adenine(1519)-N(6))-dimethyltransferase RsmA [Bacteroidia bacterium]|jgi:16S rRNA (adenine1518-N6/adenine1519-N6)-dimethyltransferase|nr:16S rRNA (adenine(1518)-N(6)/adenine(1519)-N(6))-dimethyltransferase RsmA [Bacteroidia bacterium]
MNYVKAKKHLGQHFLKDEEIAQRIVEAGLKNNPLSLLEIGPGTGVLTKYLIERENFFAIDVDRESIEFLKKNYPKYESKIISGDFLQIDLHRLFPSKFSIIGNFPYNISTQIMFEVYDHRDKIETVVGMFQKEVAERIVVKPGTKAYGILSVLLQAYYDIEYLFTVEPGAFNPPPKVRSAVIRLTRNKTGKLDCDEKLFKAIVKLTFNQRRKMVRNGVKSFVKDESIIAHRFFTMRPEQLSVADFVELTRMIEKQV